MSRSSALITLLVLLVAWGAACLPAAAGVSVVATIPPLAAIAAQIGGDRADVTALLQAGASPHTYEARPRDAVRVAEADLVLAAGAGLDDWVVRLVGASGGASRTLYAVDAAHDAGFAIPLAPGTLDHDHGGGTDPDGGDAGGDEDDHEHGGAFDPHVWLDPIVVRDAVAPAIAERLAALAPEHAGYFRQNLLAFQAELDELHAWIGASFAETGSVEFITYHSAWAYFARRYGLREVAVIASSPGKEPSAKWVADVIRTARSLGVRLVVAEPQFNPQAANVIAAEIGGSVVVLDPIGGGPGRATYAELLRFNTNALVNALRAR